MYQWAFVVVVYQYVEYSSKLSPANVFNPPHHKVYVFDCSFYSNRYVDVKLKYLQCNFHLPGSLLFRGSVYTMLTGVSILHTNIHHTHHATKHTTYVTPHTRLDIPHAHTITKLHMHTRKMENGTKNNSFKAPNT